MRSSNVSFQANFIKPVKILKKVGREKFVAYPVSVVEIDTNNIGDVRALRAISLSWDKYNYVQDIYEDVSRLRLGGDDGSQMHVFAITLQRDNFDKINKDDIIGVAEFVENKELNELVYLQVEPEHNYGNMESQFKHIGKSILNFLEEKFFEKPIKVFSTGSAIDFYLKNGFSAMPNNCKSTARCLWNA